MPALRENSLFCLKSTDLFRKTSLQPPNGRHFVRLEKRAKLANAGRRPDSCNLDFEFGVYRDFFRRIERELSVLHKSSLFVNQVSDAFWLHDRHHVNVVSVLGFPHARLDLIKRHGEVRRYLFRRSERTRHNNGFAVRVKLIF